MVVTNSFRRLLDSAQAQLERAGEHLLVFYQAVSIATRGRVPFRAVSPLALAAGTAAAGLLIVILATALLGSLLFTHAPATAGEVVVADAPQFATVLRCSQCGWSRPAKAVELARGAGHSRAYRCEKCGAEAAHPQRLPQAMLATPPPKGASR